MHAVGSSVHTCSGSAKLSFEFFPYILSLNCGATEHRSVINAFETLRFKTLELNFSVVIFVPVWHTICSY